MATGKKDISQRGKGRPRCFDRDQALLRALDVFWRHGYEPASIAALCQAMEINPPSLYSTFGNKARLFMEAVNFYKKTYWEAPCRKFMEEIDIFQAVDEFFKESARILVPPDLPCGCMLVLAAINVSADAEEITASIRNLRFATGDMFAERIRRGIADGQLPPDTDVAALAGALKTLLEGLSIQARDGLSQVELDRIASYAARLLHSQPTPSRP